MTSPAWRTHCLLTNDQMAAVDAAAIAGGTPGIELMENAGRAVADEIRRRWRPRPALAMCGPGNNGGDGFVIARFLKNSGWPVQVCYAPKPDRLTGDARTAWDRWLAAGGEQASVPWNAVGAGCFDLFVDALFGAGLTRPVEGEAGDLLKTVERRASKANCPVVAVDMPSGVDGNTGLVRGVAIHVDVTVTFFRPKPGHMMLPGRDLCGDLVVRDIGIPDSVLMDIAPTAALNDPDLWKDGLRPPSSTDHKYTRGHALVVAGEMPGASILAARAAGRVGAGMVTVGWMAEDDAACAGPMDSHLPAACLKRRFDTLEQLVEFRRDRKVQTLLVGQGFGISLRKNRKIKELIQEYKNCILDADAISFFETDPELFFRQIGAKVILTPHPGEFGRIDDDARRSEHPGKLVRTRKLAGAAGCVVVHKGYDTVIADGDGKVVVNANGSPSLASGGTGDVLAGTILGLRAQGMPPFEAACAAVWLNGDAAARVGQGLIADDLPNALSESMKQAFTNSV